MNRILLFLSLAVCIYALPTGEHWYCRHKEDAPNHKCYEGCATKVFSAAGLSQAGHCPSKYSTETGKSETVKQCSDGITNLKNCMSPLYPVSVEMKTKGEGDMYTGLWETFKQDFSKTYEAEEHERRFATFKENIDFIMEHNKKAEEHGFTVGVNEFADMSRHEFKEVMLRYQPERKKANPIKVFDESATPSSIDWVSKGAVTPVKNQGQCGSCWAFSTTGSTEGAVQIATGKLISLSEQELVDCAGSYGNQGCNGGLMDDGFKYIEAKGDALESTYAYTGKTGTCSTAKQGQAAVKQGELTTFHDVTPKSQSQLEAAVGQQPVSVAIEADQSGFQFYKSGVFSGTCGTKLDHGVLVVGFGTDSGKDYWKVKNSWGTSWGQAGYILLARGKANATDAGNRRLLGGGGGGSADECGIEMQPSYPTIKASFGAPATAEYEKPPCQSGEDAVQVQGLSGDFCSPKCSTSSPCPAVPSGVTGKGQCILQTAGSSGPTNCAIICNPSGNGDCPSGASCQAIQGTGICTYPSSKFSFAIGSTMTKIAN